MLKGTLPRSGGMRPLFWLSFSLDIVILNYFRNQIELDFQFKPLFLTY